jgi:hypothetical protein
MMIDTIETDEDGEEIFSQRQSLIFKALAVRRIYDRVNDTLIYVSFSRQVRRRAPKWLSRRSLCSGLRSRGSTASPSERLGRDRLPHRIDPGWHIGGRRIVGGGSWGTAASILSAGQPRWSDRVGVPTRHRWLPIAPSSNATNDQNQPWDTASDVACAASRRCCSAATLAS